MSEVQAPILHWSPSAAEQDNREEVDHLHGLIDATDADALMVWTVDGWADLSEMPADAVQLVDYVPVAEIDVEYGVLLPLGYRPGPGRTVDRYPSRDRALRIVADGGSGEVVQRTVRRGQWGPVAP